MAEEAQRPEDEEEDGRGEASGEGQKPRRPKDFVQQQVQHTQVSARVPDHVKLGVFSTGAIVLQGPHEFIIDFILRLAGAPQVASRVIVPPTVMASFIAALKDNLDKYQQKHGAPPPLPQGQAPATPPTIEDIYQELKLPDERLSGAYANTVMIGHTPSEFWFDFITSFFPRSAVSSRVYLSAAQAPRFLNTLTQSFNKFRQDRGQAE